MRGSRRSARSPARPIASGTALAPALGERRLPGHPRVAALVAIAVSSLACAEVAIGSEQWAIYGFFIWLTARNLRAPGPTRVVRLAGPRTWRGRVAGFLGVAVLVSLIPFAAFGSVFVIWGLGAAVALWMFAWWVRRTAVDEAQG